MGAAGSSGGCKKRLFRVGLDTERPQGGFLMIRCIKVFILQTSGKALSLTGGTPRLGAVPPCLVRCGNSKVREARSTLCDFAPANDHENVIGVGGWEVVHFTCQSGALVLPGLPRYLPPGPRPFGLDKRRGVKSGGAPG